MAHKSNAMIEEQLNEKGQEHYRWLKVGARLRHKLPAARVHVLLRTNYDSFVDVHIFLKALYHAVDLAVALSEQQ